MTRNAFIYATAFWLNYLSAPVTYVGVLQAALLSDYQAPAFVATMPGALFALMTIAPLILAWYSPHVSFLKRNVVACYSLNALSMISVALVLLLSSNPILLMTVVVIQSAVIGACLTSGHMFLWEAIGRGTDETKRGKILALTFGVGPILAVIGSLASQAILTGRLGDWEFPTLGTPYNYAVLYIAAAVAMLVVAVAGCFLVIPLPEKEPEPEPFWAGLRSFSSNRVLLVATIATVLFYSANTVVSIMSLYTEAVLNAPASDSVGYQNTLRFAFKALAGLGLGWLLSRTNPKATMLVTASFFLMGQLWAMFATGPVYLFAFGLFGIGELIGVYGPNYILSASKKEDYRRNMAVIIVIGTPTAFTGQLFGGIVSYCKMQGHNDLGFQISFGVCSLMIVVGLVLAFLLLPARPQKNV